MIKYFKNFKEYIPTWVICIFMFFWIFGWTLVVGLILLIIQCLQRKKLKLKIETLKQIEQKNNELKEQLFSLELNRKELQEEISKLNDLIKDKEKEIATLSSEISKLNDLIKKKDADIDIFALENSKMKQKYDFALYPGNYLVGRDIPLGGYILSSHKNKTGYIRLYPNITKYKKDEDEIIFESFEGNYHVSLTDNNTYLVVKNADICKIRDFDISEFQKKEEISSIQSELNILNNELIEQYYMFSNYDGITSEDCKNKLSILKQKEKQIRELQKDIEIIGEVESSKVKEKIIRKILRSFNSECDNIMSNVKLSNINVMRNKIQKSYETLNKLYCEDGICLTTDILKLKLEQITLMYTYELKYQQEKEIQKAIKEQMIEEAKAQKEIEEQKKKIDKDLQQYVGEVNKLIKYLQKTQNDVEKELYADKIRELEEKIKQLESEKENAIQREANAKAGFVYIISNIGSFGENIYKIGMTRRLEPMDRIKELSSASVPFEFDVHAMIFSDDAPYLENELHKYFAEKAVNKVNPRKEFYNVDIDEIEKIVKEKYNDTVQFTKIPLATEYRQSISK